MSKTDDKVNYEWTVAVSKNGEEDITLYKLDTADEAARFLYLATYDLWNDGFIETRKGDIVLADLIGTDDVLQFSIGRVSR